MSESLHLADSAWNDAEALVDRLEVSGQRCATVAAFYDEVTRGMITTTDASDASLWQLDGGQPRLLSRKYADVTDASLAPFVPTRYDADSSTDSGWMVAQQWDSNERLITRQRADAPTSTLPACELVLCLCFDSQFDRSLQQPVEQLCSAVIGLALTVTLRFQITALRQIHNDPQVSDRLITDLYRGGTLKESFSAIAAATATHRQVDRVSLVRVRGSTANLVSLSSPSLIDRRSRQVRLLERLTQRVVSNRSTLRFTVGDPSQVDENVTGPLEAYLDDSGCRQIWIEIISRSDDDETPVAAMVLERFRLTEDEISRENLTEPGDSLSALIVDAIRCACERPDTRWQTISSRWIEGSSARKSLWFGALISIALLLLVIVPADLTLPVDGKLVAKNRARLFAPSSGTVFELPVHDGQHVEQGDPVVILRSSDLEFQETTLAGEMATAKSRLAAILASKSAGRREDPRSTLDASSQQQVLETRIMSLQKRLDLVHDQQTALTLNSPISGVVDRWDLDQSLLSRPVLHGQHLLDIVNSDRGWTVQLDVPDEEIGYVLQAQREEPCVSTFTLRSDPTRVFHGKIQHIEPNAHINPEGKSVVRATFDFDADRTDAFRVGATVTASIHCGTRSLGFVWFRSVIEWIRRQTWL